MQKALVVVAHPDDEVLGCGGTVARLRRQGVEVRFIVCGEGVTSREDADQTQVAELDVHLRQAAKILGVDDVFHLEFPDNRFDARDRLDLIKAVEAHGLSFEPDVVFTHHPSDLNIDHRYVHDAVMTAFRPLPHTKPVALYGVEIASSTGWGAAESAPAFVPNVFADITETLDQKIAAMDAYASEKRAWPHPRSAEALRAAARYWGSRVGLEAAEPFVLFRSYF
ncbi:MAG: PIG-L deacetylase family protein [Candidatus Lernaella stagnicola]|nr:PIG-L deacetylase family protein [Candidatus Lernaella stagnicola]